MEEESYETKIKGTLYILMSKLKSEKNVYLLKKHLNNIKELIIKETYLIENLINWKFFEIYVPFLLKKSIFISDTLKIIEEISKDKNQKKAIFSFFSQKQIIFFLTELIYKEVKKVKDEMVYQNEKIGRIFLLLKNILLIVDLEEMMNLLNLMKEYGLFELTNSIVTDEIAEFYGAIFMFKCYNNPRLTKSSDAKEHNTAYEVQRRQFESEIYFKEKENLILKNHVSKYKLDKNLILKELSEQIYESSFYFLIENTSIFKNLHTINFIFDSGAKIIFPNVNVLFNEDFLKELEGSILENEQIEAIKVYKVLLKIIKVSDQKFLLIRKFFSGEDVFLKIVSFLKSKNVDVNIESANVLFLIYDLLESFYEENISIHSKKMKFKKEKVFDLDYFFRIVGKENIIRKIFSLLIYKCFNCKHCRFTTDENVINYEEPNECNTLNIIRLLFKIYRNTDKKYFFKPSYLVILNHYNKLRNFSFLEEYFMDFISYLSKNPYNYCKILFPFENKNKKIVDDKIEESSNEEIKNSAKKLGFNEFNKFVNNEIENVELIQKKENEKKFSLISEDVAFLASELPASNELYTLPTLPKKDQNDESLFKKARRESFRYVSSDSSSELIDEEFFLED